jgi:hypothetical protein
MRRVYDLGMPELVFELHHWPGYSPPVVAGVVQHALGASAGDKRGSVRVTACGPFATRIRLGVRPNLSGVVAREVESALARLRDPRAASA